MTSSVRHDNSSVPGAGGFFSAQLSYSTADVERTIFYGTVNQPSEPAGPEVPPVSMLVVNGEMFVLDEGSRPEWPRLPPDAAIFRLSEDQESA